jgi:two-component system sensor histidine kinase AlgZ
MKQIAASTPTPGRMIPDFCAGPALLQLGVLVELVVVVLSLASTGDPAEVQLRFIWLSVFLQWIALCSAAVLCGARRWLKLAQVRALFLTCWGLLLLVTLSLSLAAWYLDQRFLLGLALGASPWPFAGRNILISAIVSLLLLRYFWERHQWQEQARAEAEGRYLALQARIRPHFLFNALNSLAELIVLKPEQAEEMVVDLADLFRVSLDARRQLATLAEEIDIVRGYLRIEQIRLGDRLRVEWQVDEAALDAQVPRLALQPLVENAVLHGISRLRGGGTLRIAAARDKGALGALAMTVENPLPPPEAGPRTEGSGMAVNNIAQRIKVLYGERASLALGETRNAGGAIFRAELRVPYLPAGGAEHGRSWGERQ